MPLRTIARMTALRPGQSPPPVRTPMRAMARESSGTARRPPTVVLPGPDGRGVSGRRCGLAAPAPEWLHPALEQDDQQDDDDEECAESDVHVGLVPRAGVLSVIALI